MIATGCRPANWIGRVRLQDRSSAVVHAEHHGGGAALLCDAAEAGRRAPRTQAKPARFGGTDRAQQTGVLQDLDGSLRKGAGYGQSPALAVRWFRRRSGLELSDSFRR